ncbi:MAG: hypothetical protein R2825_16950 [Saprospiraceae bacterium]
MLLHVRDVVLAVNQAYIRSAAMSDDLLPNRLSTSRAATAT